MALTEDELKALANGLNPKYFYPSKSYEEVLPVLAKEVLSWREQNYEAIIESVNLAFYKWCFVAPEDSDSE